MFKKQACCKECIEQYPLPEWSLRSKQIQRGLVCPKCAKIQRECTKLKHQTELEKETNKGTHLTVQQEIEKRTTLQQQQQHEKEEAEKKRQHEAEIETKKSETAIAEAKIKSEYELSKLVEQNRHKEAMQNQQKQLELKIQEEQTRCELDKQAKQLEHEATMQEKQHRHELAMQVQRNEEKRLEMEMLSCEAEILEQNGERWLDLKCLETELKLQLLKGSSVRSRNLERQL